MDKSSYGEHFQEHLIEQYKICVEMADRVSARRIQANSFYISLLSTLLALLSLIERQLIPGYQNLLLFLTSILGLTLCLTWFTNIESYRKLNSAKFFVINEIKKYLPFRCFTLEWKDLTGERTGEKEKRKKYKRLTIVEKYVPIIFSIPYFGLCLYSLLSLFGLIK
jgi:hypothetical protein